jgi:hypothetical protein
VKYDQFKHYIISHNECSYIPSPIYRPTWLTNSPTCRKTTPLAEATHTTSSKLQKAKANGRKEKTKKANENVDRTITLLGATLLNVLDQSVLCHQPVLRFQLQLLLQQSTPSWGTRLTLALSYITVPPRTKSTPGNHHSTQTLLLMKATSTPTRKLMSTAT